MCQFPKLKKITLATFSKIVIREHGVHDESELKKFRERSESMQAQYLTS